MFGRLRHYARRMYERMILAWHRRRLFSLSSARDMEYIAYLDAQLNRTLLKRNSKLQRRCRDFVDKISTVVELKGRHVLCVGCRNKEEIDYFRSNGAGEVVGIDLYSNDPGIKIMDMHAMSFEDSSFDLVFSSHSLEHAYDPRLVVAEISRVVTSGGFVAIEVPVDYQIDSADRFDFHSLENLHTMFSPAIDSIIWAEKFPVAAGYGTAVIRTIFTMGKG